MEKRTVKCVLKLVYIIDQCVPTSAVAGQWEVCVVGFVVGVICTCSRNDILVMLSFVHGGELCREGA